MKFRAPYRNWLALSLFLGLVLTQVFALAAGNLVASFGNAGAGWSMIDFGTEVDRANDIALQTDGKIVLTGSIYNLDSNSDVALARLNPDGQLDTTFGSTGYLYTNFSAFDEHANAVAIQADGKIIIAGQTSSLGDIKVILARYNMNGELDTTFGDEGLVVTDLDEDFAIASSIKIAPDGKIVIGGVNIDYALFARYNTDGSLDETFSGDGHLTIDTINGSILGLVIDDAGNIVGVTSTGEKVIRLTSSGDLDTTFGTNGVVDIDKVGADIIAYPGNKYVVLTTSDDVYSPHLIRLNSDGSFDNTFDSDGIATMTLSYPYFSGRGLLVDGDGNIIYVGMVRNQPDFDYEAFIGKLTPSGSPDLSFSEDGYTTFDTGTWLDWFNGVVLTPDNQLITAGYASGDTTSVDMLVVKYLNEEVAEPASFNLTSPSQAITFNLDALPEPLTFTWETSVGADSYRFQLYRDSLAGTKLVEHEIATNSYTLTNEERALIATGTHLWTVSAINAVAEVDANTDFTFTVSLPAPSAFDLLSPADEAAFTIGALPIPFTFIWETSTSATTYTLKVYEDGNATAIIEKTGLSATSYNLLAEEVALITTGVYSWTVSAINITDEVAATTDFTFTVSPVIPAAFDLLTPADDTVFTIGAVPDPFAFQWEASTSATSYTLSLYEQGNATAIVQKTGLSTTTYSLSAEEHALITGDAYHWDVVAISDSNGTTSSTDFSFTLVAADLITNGGFEIAGATPKLAANWTGVKLVPTKDRRVCNSANILAFEGECAFRFKAQVKTTGRLLRQRIEAPISTVGDELTLSAQIRRAGLVGKAIIKVKVMSGKTLVQTLNLQIPAGTAPYTLFSQAVELSATPTHLIVTIEARSTTGTFFVDDLQLYSLPSNTRGGVRSELPFPEPPQDWRN